MKFKKSLVEDINDGWELEDTESGLLDVINDLERVAYELKNCIRGAYTKCTTYKELAIYLKNKAEELDYEADALMSLDESLIKDTELSEALSIEDAKRKLDKYPYQITIKAEDEKEFKKFLSSKNISFIIDDHLTADGKPGKNSTFHLKYPKCKNLKEDKKSLDPDEIWKILFYNEDCGCVLYTDKRHFIDEILSASFKEAKNYDSVEYMAEDTYDHIINGEYPEISPEDWLKFIKQIAAEEDWFREVDEVNEIEEFTSLIEVIYPEHAGAPYPPFKRLYINESNIPHTMRFKSWDASVIDGGKNILLYWVTQEEFKSDAASKFIKEIERAINAMIETYKFKKPFKLKIKAVCRDGAKYGEVQKELSFNTIGD